MSRHRQPERAGAAGFTLLEVMVALAVLAAVVAAIGSLSSANRRAARFAAKRVELAQTARRLLNELGDRKAFAAGAVVGEGRGYAWQFEFQPFGEGSVDSFGIAWRPYRVALRVVAPGGAQLEVETVRLGRAGP